MTANTSLYSRVLLASVGLSYAATGPAMAQAGYIDLAAIDNEIAAFTGKSIGQTGGAMMPVDRRLRLNGCRSPLALAWRTARRDTVSVECPDPGSWHLYVPVRPSETGAVAIARGESISIAVVGDGFSVAQPGEAMDSGAVGDWIRVRGVKDGSPRGDTMRARVTRPGEVEVPMRD